MQTPHSVVLILSAILLFEGQQNPKLKVGIFQKPQVQCWNYRGLLVVSFTVAGK